MDLMHAPFSPQDRVYEQACDQAIAMCDGNLRSTIIPIVTIPLSLIGVLVWSVKR